MARRRRTGTGIWTGELLPFASSLRAALGEYLASTFVRFAACGQFSLHHGQRPRTQRIQLDCFERGGPAAGDDRNRGDCGTAKDYAGTRKRRQKETLAHVAGALRGGSDSDDQAEFVSLAVPSEAAVRTISVEMDGHRGSAVCVFFSGRDDAAAGAMDLVRAGACRSLRDGDVARQKYVVGLR